MASIHILHIGNATWQYILHPCCKYQYAQLLTIDLFSLPTTEITPGYLIPHLFNFLDLLDNTNTNICCFTTWSSYFKHIPPNSISNDSVPGLKCIPQENFVYWFLLMYTTGVWRHVNMCQLFVGVQKCTWHGLKMVIFIGKL